MDLASHLSCVFDAFSSYRVSFSLMTSLRMMCLGPGHQVRALIHFLKNALVMLVVQIQLVVLVAQLLLVV